MIHDQFSEKLTADGLAKISRQKRYELRKVAKGLCRVCTREAVGGTGYCEAHLLAARSRNRPKRQKAAPPITSVKVAVAVLEKKPPTPFFRR